MRAALSIALFLSLLGFLVAHVALVVGIARLNAPLRAGLALVIPPLAPFWGYELGMKRRAQAWLGALASYAFLAGFASGAFTS